MHQLKHAVVIACAVALLSACGQSDEQATDAPVETTAPVVDRADSIAPAAPFERTPLDLTEQELEALASEIHDRVFVFDAHIDIPVDFGEGENDPGRETTMPVDLPKMAAGGLDGAAFALFSRQGPRIEEGYAAAWTEVERKLNGLQSMAQDHADQIGIAATVNEVRALQADGKRVAIISMLNGYALGPDLGRLDDLFDGGLRMIGFTHAGHNDLADSSRPQEDLGDGPVEHGGLSELGSTLIAEMNARGIIIDVSQVTTAALVDMVALTEAPVVASHSGIKALVDSPRNLSDAELQAVADTGGVVHVVAYPAYTKQQPPEYRQALMGVFQQFNLRSANDLADMDAATRAAYDAAVAEINQRFPKANLQDYVNALDYAVDLIGIDHVGISTDMGHGGGVVGWMDASASLEVTKELVRRGYDQEAIAKLWGENFLRVMADVAAVAEIYQGDSL